MLRTAEPGELYEAWRDELYFLKENTVITQRIQTEGKTLSTAMVVYIFFYHTNKSLLWIKF